jgi:hypothetical protein
MSDGRAPDYLGVGCLPPGSRWWHGLLLEHPDVRSRGPDDMALNYFDQFCLRAMTDEDVRAYHRRFTAPEGRLDGEWSHRYAYDVWTPPLVRRAAPEARILVMLLDPAHRYRRKLAVPRPELDRDVVSYWLAGMEARGRYATQLRHLWRHVDRERTLVLQHERCRADPAGEYARMLRFLGLREDFRPARLAAPPEDAPRPGPVARARRTLGRARRRLLGRPTTTAAPAALPELWPDLGRALWEDLAGEMEELVELVPDVDLDLWEDFRGLEALHARGVTRARA